LTKRNQFWIKDVFDPCKQGLLHRQLKVPQNRRIPKTLLEEIKVTDLNERIKNPTKTGKRDIKVTRKLKKRVVAVWNANYA